MAYEPEGAVENTGSALGVEARCVIRKLPVVADGADLRKQVTKAM